MAAQSSGVDQIQAELSIADIKKLHAYRKQITDSITLVMRQHIFDNMGEWGSVRAIPAASQYFVDLLYWRADAQVGEQKWAEQLYDLVRRGLGSKTAVALIDTLYDELQAYLGIEAVPFIRQYRQDFFNAFIEARQRIIVADHENIHKSLQETLTKQVQQERQLREKLEEERELALKRAVELETVAEVSANTTAILDQEKLLQGVVDLTTQRFELYHTHIYLLNAVGDTLVVAAGAGEAGRQMKAKNHQIPMAEEHSLVVSAARSHQGVIVNDVQQSPNFLPNPLLPDTCSELAVPLIVGEQLLGVLDVQANRIDYFTDEDIKVFTTLAAQVAIALQNVRRYDEIHQALEELTRLQRVMVREGWESYVQAKERPLLGFSFDGQEVTPVIDANAKEVTAPETIELMAEPHADTPDEDALVSLPLAVRGEEIGQLGLRSSDGSPISQRKQELLKTIAQQVSEALERTRLSEQTQFAFAETKKQAEELATINTVNEVASSQLNLSELLVTVGVTIRRTFDASSTYLALYDSQTGIISYPYFGDSEGVHLETDSHHIEKDDSFTCQVILSRQPLLHSRIRSNEEIEEHGGSIVGDGAALIEHSFMAVPMIVGKEVVGVIGVSDLYERHSYNEDDLHLLSTLSSTVGVAIRNAQQYEAAQRRAEREALINAINQKIQSAPTVESAMKTAVTELGQALKLKQALVELTTKQENGHSN